MWSDFMNIFSSVSKRPAPVSLKLGGEKMKIDEVLVFDDSHINTMGDSLGAETSNFPVFVVLKLMAGFL